MVEFIKKLLRKLLSSRKNNSEEINRSEYVLQGGELYIYKDKKKKCFKFAKVLASYPEESVVFIRGYKQKFDKPPNKINQNDLSVGSMDDPEGPTIGCAPIAYDSIFQEWVASPDYGISELTDDEIDTVRKTIKMMNEE
jgi:hypothetical protein